jgi:hypothetical protein
VLHFVLLQLEVTKLLASRKPLQWWPVKGAMQRQHLQLCLGRLLLKTPAGAASCWQQPTPQQWRAVAQLLQTLSSPR